MRHVRESRPEGQAVLPPVRPPVSPVRDQAPDVAQPGARESELGQGQVRVGTLTAGDSGGFGGITPGTRDRHSPGETSPDLRVELTHTMIRTDVVHASKRRT